MILIKAIVILFFIALNMQLVAPTSSGIQVPRSSVKSVPSVRKRIPASKPKRKAVLLDTTNTVEAVEAIGEGVKKMDISQEQPVLQVNKKLERLFDQGNYEEIIELGKNMSGDEFLIQLFPVIKTFEQFKGLASHLKNHHLMASGAGIPISALQNITGKMKAMELTEEMDDLRGRSVPQVNKEFREAIIQRKYNDLFTLSKDMNNEEFLKQLCPVVKTLEQYKGVVVYLKQRNLVASFYVYGDMKVVREVILAESGVYDKCGYVFDGGSLEAALPLAFKEDRHNRIVELFSARKEITADEDNRRRPAGIEESFRYFVYWFLYNLVPTRDSLALKRFFIPRGDELRNKFPDIISRLYQELVGHLRERLDSSGAEKLLIELVGQPSSLTPTEFTSGFLLYNKDKDRANLIKYGYREAIEEGLKRKYQFGAEKLWQVLRNVRLNEFPEKFPRNAKARAAICKRFPTKQQKEEQWAEENAETLFDKLEGLRFIINLPDELWTMITEYAISWFDT